MSIMACSVEISSESTKGCSCTLAGTRAHTPANRLLDPQPTKLILQQSKAAWRTLRPAATEWVPILSLRSRVKLSMLLQS